MLKLICWIADIRNLKHGKDVVCHGAGYGSGDGHGNGYGNKSGDGFGHGYGYVYRKGYGDGTKCGYGNGHGNGHGDPYAPLVANYRELSDLEMMLEQICEVDLS